MTLSRVLAVVLAFDAIVVAIVVGVGIFGAKSDAAGEGLKQFYLLLLGVPFAIAALLALVPFAPARWVSLALASILPLLVVFAIGARVLAPVGERLEATGASEFARAPARQAARAIVDGDSATLRRLVREQHLDLTTEGDEQRTLLGFAIARRPAFIPLLVELGADPNRRATNGEMPLEIALAESQSDAQQPGNTDALRLLFDAGARPNERTRFDTWLLELAVRNRRPDQVQLFLDHGADAKTVGDRGWTMPMFAVMARQWSTASELLSRGASATAKGTYGDSLAGVYDDALRAYASAPTSVERSQIEAFREAARRAGVQLVAPR